MQGPVVCLLLAAFTLQATGCFLDEDEYLPHPCLPHSCMSCPSCMPFHSCMPSPYPWSCMPCCLPPSPPKKPWKKGKAKPKCPWPVVVCPPALHCLPCTSQPCASCSVPQLPAVLHTALSCLPSPSPPAQPASSSPAHIILISCPSSPLPASTPLTTTAASSTLACSAPISDCTYQPLKAITC